MSENIGVATGKIMLKIVIALFKSNGDHPTGRKFSG